MILVRVVNKSAFDLPKYATEDSAGVDLRANISSALELKPMQRALVPTGIFIELPRGYEAQIRPRSGLAAKHGITVLNSPGTIDPDYRGEIKVILINLSDKPYSIEPGERIAQMIISKFERIQWQEVDSLQPTDRGQGGFGHSGKK